MCRFRSNVNIAIALLPCCLQQARAIAGLLCSQSRQDCQCIQRQRLSSGLQQRWIGNIYWQALPASGVLENTKAIHAESDMLSCTGIAWCRSRMLSSTPAAHRPLGLASWQCAAILDPCCRRACCTSWKPMALAALLQRLLGTRTILRSSGPTVCVDSALFHRYAPPPPPPPGRGERAHYSLNAC